VAGWASVSEGTLTLEVPEGSARKVQVLGRYSAEGCGGFSTNLSESGYAIYELGSTTVDLYEDRTVSIALNSDVSDTPTLACGLDDINPTAGVWDQSQWDSGAAWAE
jgi:hypothetical protein